jgi:hypothetical protein
MLRQSGPRGCGRYYFWHHEDRMPTHGYAETREAAMAAFAKELAARELARTWTH